MAGAGPLEARVGQAAAADPRIEYLGYTTPADFFPRLTALVVPSVWHDPSPVVIRETYAREPPRSRRQRVLRRAARLAAGGQAASG